MRSLSLVSVIFFCIPVWAQPVIGGAGYTSPVPVSVAPGQVITLFVQGADNPLNAGISVNYRQGTDRPATILEVRPISSCLGIPLPAGSTCGTILAVTVQLPFEMLTLCPLCGRLDIPASISVSVGGETASVLSVQPLNDQVHILTACDVMLSNPPSRPTSALPCPPMVAHEDGNLVTAANPATSGEKVIAYAVGLGQTDPPLADGQVATENAATQTIFAIDFNYRPNALATKPLGPSFIGPQRRYPTPLFTGAAAGYFGLYQITFIVPPTPDGLSRCAVGAGVPYSNVIRSNLTVSIGSSFSYDGAGFCVAPVPTT
jgi:uncharacterized protein (TIGR03437 family)